MEIIEQDELSGKIPSIFFQMESALSFAVGSWCEKFFSNLQRWGVDLKQHDVKTPPNASPQSKRNTGIGSLPIKNEGGRAEFYSNSISRMFESTVGWWFQRLGDVCLFKP